MDNAVNLILRDIIQRQGYCALLKHTLCQDLLFSALSDHRKERNILVQLCRYHIPRHIIAYKEGKRSQQELILYINNLLTISSHQKESLQWGINTWLHVLNIDHLPIHDTTKKKKKTHKIALYSFIIACFAIVLILKPFKQSTLEVTKNQTASLNSTALPSLNSPSLMFPVSASLDTNQSNLSSFTQEPINETQQYAINNKTRLQKNHNNVLLKTTEIQQKSTQEKPIIQQALATKKQKTRQPQTLNKKKVQQHPLALKKKKAQQHPLALKKKKAQQHPLVLTKKPIKPLIIASASTIQKILVLSLSIKKNRNELKALYELIKITHDKSYNQQARKIKEKVTAFQKNINTLSVTYSQHLRRLCKFQSATLQKELKRININTHIKSPLARHITHCKAYQNNASKQLKMELSQLIR